MRIILYTGKGGVGKTSIAAATACKIASSGKRVLVISTDQAHSLSDSFNIKLGNEPLKIVDNLYGIEIDTVLENEKTWSNLKTYFKQLLLFKAEENIESEELLVFPAFEELLSLIKIKEIHDKGQYDVLIVDCAPTGETMSLLKFPDIFKWWMEKIFPIKKKGAKVVKPIIDATIKVPMPTDDTFDEIQKLYEKVDELHKLMLDKEKVSLRIVTTPERIVVKEAKKSFSYLHLFDYNVDAVIINKIFPEESIKGYFEKWDTIQKESIEEIDNSFKGIAVLKLSLMNNELREYSTLKYVGDIIYKDVNPEEVFFTEKIFELKKNGDKYIFSINMPFVDKEQLNLSQKGDEITISIKNERGSIIVPKKLQAKEIISAKYDEGRLNIFFN
ncbi:ArsA family ATPase [Clostridium sporogenes]|uniref:ArsA family ATPase n=1 Tax=Clostridium sporogenes TaxID=1509 RepID=UPI0013C8E31E|nr:ArsA family ATPase [Clostridium sporogenes]NFQ02505.1 ArsA family ATPase [Clostridium sporogenes]NFQ41996.1 ArsA family ATPase [Clostridium sporogenes]NFT02731.1 ArsA family ATPase [Clostridium sporogenes]NFT31207.1 ArsA family ATPase [Clostridium sporogenes]NFT39279.1 ArsA family ATPase [Clostridium sporogenes]